MRSIGTVRPVPMLLIDRFHRLFSQSRPFNFLVGRRRSQCARDIQPKSAQTESTQGCHYEGCQGMREDEQREDTRLIETQQTAKHKRSNYLIASYLPPRCR